MKYTILTILLLLVPIVGSAQFYGGEPPGQIAPCDCDQSLLMPINESGREALENTIGGIGENTASLWHGRSSAWQEVSFIRNSDGSVSNVNRLPSSGIYDLGCFISMLCNYSDIPNGIGVAIE